MELEKLLRPLNNNKRLYSCDRCKHKAKELFYPINSKLFLCGDCILLILGGLKNSSHDTRGTIKSLNRNWRKIIFFAVAGLVFFIVGRSFIRSF